MKGAACNYDAYVILCCIVRKRINIANKVLHIP